MLAHFPIIKGCHGRLSYLNDKKLIQLAMRPAVMAVSVLGWQGENETLSGCGGVVGHNDPLTPTAAPP